MHTKTNFRKLVLRVTWGTIVSLPFFAPIPFYYTLSFGLVPWLVIDGEDSVPGDFMWGPFKLHFYPKIFTICIMLWIFALGVVSKWVRYLESLDKTA